MNYEQELQKGAEAQQLLNNPIFKEVMGDIKNKLHEITLNTPTTEMVACMDAIRNEQLFESIERMIVSYIYTGKMAQQMMEETKEVKKEFKR